MLIHLFTCSDDRIHYMDSLGACYMNAICVGAMLWCSYHEIRSYDILALIKRKMHLLAVLDTKIAHKQVLAGPEG